MYRPTLFRLFWTKGGRRDRAVVLAAWLGTLAASIGLGLASITLGWSGLPIHFAGVDVFATLYPPLIFATLWVLWFGFWWGFLPAYLSTLALALHSGMPLHWSLLFAFADPLGLAVFAIGYRALPIPYDLRSFNALVVFVVLSFVGAVFGSAGSVIWIMTNGVGRHDVLPVWQGWWLGAFLQNLTIVAPFLWAFSRPLARWRGGRGWRAEEGDRGAWTVLGGATILAGVLLFLYASVRLNALAFETASATGDDGAVRAAARALAESSQSMYWVMTIIVLFAFYVAHQLFSHWSAATRRAAAELSATNTHLADQARRLADALDSERLAHERLKATQAQLIQAEKMAALAHLVAGVAHEINTPLGIALLASTHLGDETRRLEQRVANGQVRKSDLTDYLGVAKETSTLLHTHVARAAGLVQSFKQVAADQVADERRGFNLRASLEELASSLAPALRKAGHVLTVECPDDIVMDSYPGALGQVVTNLAMNAVDHAFEPGQAGTLRIDVTMIDADTVALSFSDDGRGIPADIRSKVFDPFFTTRRGAGNTGLGLHIVFNLVTSRLGGRIALEDGQGRGCRFLIRMPVTAPVAG
ncbi:sensor histidine kinase [Azospirillum soli]|uniref:sensor histidine kinase n=1 Tax=Azospirillum soli TaxID=1304799 RepID=UPI001AE7D0AB|nr:signal transduction histidine kinase [Azospirillum soli]